MAKEPCVKITEATYRKMERRNEELEAALLASKLSREEKCLLAYARKMAARFCKKHGDEYMEETGPCPDCLREDRERLTEALLDALCQACRDSADGLFDTGALSAYRDGWELAVEMGVAEREGELVGRRGFYRVKEKAK
jgi:hypothetical protein